MTGEDLPLNKVEVTTLEKLINSTRVIKALEQIKRFVKN